MPKRRSDAPYAYNWSHFLDDSEKRNSPASPSTVCIVALSDDEDDALVSESAPLFSSNQHISRSKGRSSDTFSSPSKKQASAVQVSRSFSFEKFAQIKQRLSEASLSEKNAHEVAANSQNTEAERYLDIKDARSPDHQSKPLLAHFKRKICAKNETLNIYTWLTMCSSIIEGTLEQSQAFERLADLFFKTSIDQMREEKLFKQDCAQIIEMLAKLWLFADVHFSSDSSAMIGEQQASFKAGVMRALRSFYASHFPPLEAVVEGCAFLFRDNAAIDFVLDVESIAKMLCELSSDFCSRVCAAFLGVYCQIDLASATSLHHLESFVSSPKEAPNPQDSRRLFLEAMLLFYAMHSLHLSPPNIALTKHIAQFEAKLDFFQTASVAHAKNYLFRIVRNNVNIHSLFNKKSFIFAPEQGK